MINSFYCCAFWIFHKIVYMSWKFILGRGKIKPNYTCRITATLLIMIYRVNCLTEGLWDLNSLISSGSFLGHFFWVILLGLNQYNFPLSTEWLRAVRSAYRIRLQTFEDQCFKKRGAQLSIKGTEQHLLKCWPYVIAQQYPCSSGFELFASLLHKRVMGWPFFL